MQFLNWFSKFLGSVRTLPGKIFHIWEIFGFAFDQRKITSIRKLKSKRLCESVLNIFYACIFRNEIYNTFSSQKRKNFRPFGGHLTPPADRKIHHLRKIEKKFLKKSIETKFDADFNKCITSYVYLGLLKKIQKTSLFGPG